MTEDLDKKAWEVFRGALDCVDFPSYVTVNKNEDGSFSFLLNLFNKKSGSAFFYYKPSIEIIKGILTFLNDETIDSLGKELSQQTAHHLAGATAELWLKNFHLELAESFLDLHEIPLLAMFTTMQEIIDECDERSGISKKDWEGDAHKSVKELIARNVRNWGVAQFDFIKPF